MDSHSTRGALTYRTALDALGVAQKPPHGTPAYSRFVNRPLGRRLAAAAAVSGLSPNQVTALSALCSFGGLAVLAASGASPLAGIVVTALLVVGYALDSADGQVSRLTGQGSLRGEWLDHMVDCAKISTLHLCVLIHVLRLPEPPRAWLGVPMAYTVVSAVTFFGMVLTDQLRRGHGIGPAKTAGSLSVLRSLVILPSDYGALCLVFVLLAWPATFHMVYALFFVAALGLLVLALCKWWQLLPGPESST